MAKDHGLFIHIAFCESGACAKARACRRGAWATGGHGSAAQGLGASGAESWDGSEFHGSTGRRDIWRENSFLNRCRRVVARGREISHGDARAQTGEGMGRRAWRYVAKWEGHTTADGRRKLQESLRVSERPGHDEPMARRKIKSDRPVYGPPSKMPGLRYEPVNEAAWCMRLACGEQTGV